MDLTTYYKIISAQGKVVMQQKREAGETMHLAPLGYKNVRKDGRSVTVPDPATWSLVEEARQMSRQGKPLREICRVMKEKGLRSKRGKVVGLSSMHLILKRGYSSLKF